MEDHPHRDSATARADAEGEVAHGSDGLPCLEAAPQARFGGPGDPGSPETLLVGAVADCFVPTFRAIARASKLAWTSPA